jgi:hypothetical protein
MHRMDKCCLNISITYDFSYVTFYYPLNIMIAEGLTQDEKMDNKRSV